MAWNGKTVADSERHDDDYSVETDDILTDDNDIPVSVIITDFTTNKEDGIVRKYKLHSNTLGSYIMFHGDRLYILLNSDLFQESIMYQKVSFYDNMFKSGRAYYCQFRSQKALKKFINNFQDDGGITTFRYDLWDEMETPFTGLPIVGATKLTYNKIMQSFK